jgi:hypothetical protein
MAIVKTAYEGGFVRDRKIGTICAFNNIKVPPTDTASEMRLFYHVFLTIRRGDCTNYFFSK